MREWVCISSRDARDGSKVPWRNPLYLYNIDSNLLLVNRGGNINWSVYIIEASDHSYYTGISTNVERRFEQHNSGPLGAKFFNGRTPLKVVYQEGGHTRSTASKREIEIKKLTRLQKQAFLASHTGN